MKEKILDIASAYWPDSNDDRIVVEFDTRKNKWVPSKAEWIENQYNMLGNQHGSEFVDYFFIRTTKQIITISQKLIADDFWFEPCSDMLIGMNLRNAFGDNKEDYLAFEFTILFKSLSIDIVRSECSAPVSIETNYEPKEIIIESNQLNMRFYL